MTYIVVLCWGVAANSICNSMTDSPDEYGRLSECLAVASTVTRAIAKGDEHYECMRYDGREVYRYREVLDR